MKNTTYSTRLTADERQLIDEACAVLRWSPAQFIRESAVVLATRVLNTASLKGNPLDMFEQ